MSDGIPDFGAIRGFGWDRASIAQTLPKMQTKAPSTSRQAVKNGRAFVPFQASSRRVALVTPSTSANTSFASPAAFAPKALRPTGAVSRRALQTVCAAIRDGQTLDRPLRVAVIGGGPSGACAAETLAAAGIETVLIERKLDNCKVCGVAA